MSVRALAALAAALTLSSCAPDLNWREVRADEAGVRMLFPCRPVRQERRVQVGGRERTMILQACDAGGMSWALGAVQLTPDDEPMAIEQQLAQAVQANLAADSAAPAVRPAPSAGGAVRRLYRWRGRAPDGRALEAVSVFASAGTWLAQATAIAPVVTADAAEPFIESLRIGS